MNKQQLLAFARSKGYTGKAVLADVKAFILDTLGYDPDQLKVGEKTYKVDEIWARNADLPAPDPDPEPEVETKSDPEPPARVKQTGNGFIKSGRGATAEPTANTESFRIRSEKSAYKRKIRAGTAAFDDVDIAERAGAFFRLSMTRGLIDDYREKRSDLDILGIRGKDMSEGINTAGGALVPEEFNPALIWLTEKYGACRKAFGVQKMSRDQLNVPRRTSRISMSALGEGGTMTATQNAYDAVGLTAKKWGVLIKSSSELVEDSAVNIADEITNSVAEAQANTEDSAGTVGDGTSTYNGITGLVGALPSGAYIAQATSNTWITQVEKDILGLVGSVTNVDFARCAFMCSRQYFWSVPMALAQAKGGNSAAMTQLYGSEKGSAGEDAVLYGFPVYFNQTAPIVTATTARSLYFGDFKGAALIGDRRDLRVDFSDQRYFDTDQICWRATSRFTINIHGDGRASTVGPIACLKNG